MIFFFRITNLKDRCWWSGMVLTESTFKDSIRSYIELHDNIEQMSKSMREIKKKKDELAREIMDFMKTNSIDEFQVGDGKLVRKKTKRTSGMKQEMIMDSLKAAFGSEEKAMAVFEAMNAQRTITESECLRRTKG